MNGFLDDDLVLIENYKNGDQRSLERLYFKYKSMLLRIIWYYVHHREDVEDVIQNLFLKLIEGLKKYHVYKKVPFRTWLIRVAINTAKDYLRKKRHGVPVADMERWEDPGPGLLESVERRELAAEIRHLVLCLPLRYREVLVMIYFENLKYEDVARVLNKPVGTIKSRSHYGLDLLRKRLKDRIHEKD